MITKAERGELRTLIRARFKVLRADILARKAELDAELRQHVKDLYEQKDKQYADALYLVNQAADEANRKANDILRSTGLWTTYPTKSDHNIMIVRAVAPPTDERGALLVQGMARIEAKVKSAQLELDRQENDLLTRLLVGALESAEAREFLSEIPTVSSLVPADRVLALLGRDESEQPS